MVQTRCGTAGEESKLFFNFFSTGGKGLVLRGEMRHLGGGKIEKTGLAQVHFAAQSNLRD
jgi:hypothetical protein